MKNIYLTTILLGAISLSGCGGVFYPKSQDNLKKNLIPFKIHNLRL